MSLKIKFSREKRTIEAMIRIYCRGVHNSGLCKDCEELLEYAIIRLELCPFQEAKPACSRCSIHCYKKSMKNKIRNVMKYAGPRMIFTHPVLTLLHYF